MKPSIQLNKLLTLLSVLSLTVFFSLSCSDDSTGPGKIESQLKVHTVKSLEAVGVGRGGIAPGDYTLYSLRENKVITDSTSTKWDIGFSGASMIINNSVSGPGKAGAFTFDEPFDKVKKAPEDKFYKTDADTGHAIVYDDWGRYTSREKPIHALLPEDNETIVVKTADGEHYAKIKIMGWYKGNPKPSELNSDPFKRQDGYYTFKYAIQKNGSRNFN